MFDGSLPEPDALSGLDAAALVSAMSGWAAVEAAAAARKTAVVAEFWRRRSTGGHEDWAIDDWEAAAVEVGAALNMNQWRARGELDFATALARLPKVAAVFARGALTARVVATIVRRTANVGDPEALAALDATLADQAEVFGTLSEANLERAIDIAVIAVDPDARRRASSAARDRGFSLGETSDGLTEVWGRLLASDAKVLEERIAAMAAAVCDADPRTVCQRRGDALGALGAGSDRLACRCGCPQCPSAGDSSASDVVVHVIAPAETLNAQPDPEYHGEQPDPQQPDPRQSGSSVSAQSRAPSGMIVGGPVIPAEQVADLVRRGAKVVPLKPPSADPQKTYQPSRVADRWVRSRDLTCRAPGCDKPAWGADIDHTIAWPAGPTHPLNNKCYCRLHHLIKTFWSGFTDTQMPDGSVAWTTPTGHTYTTRPLSNLLFPSWDTTTARLSDVPRPPPDDNPDRGLKMPKRRRSRATERQCRVNAERALNHVENIPPF